MMREVLQRRFKRLLEESPQIARDSASSTHLPLVGEVGTEGAGRGVDAPPVIITPLPGTPPPQGGRMFLIHHDMERRGRSPGLILP